MSRRTGWTCAAPILAVGGLIVLLAVVHVGVDDDPLFVELVEAGILLVFAAAVFAVGARVVTEAPGLDATRRITAFMVGASGVVGGLAAVFVGARLVTGEATGESGYILSIGGSLGAGVGALIGYYVNRYETGLTQQAALNQRLTVLQRVLRHNIRNEVTIVDGVTQTLQARVDDPDVSDDLDTIHSHIQRVHSLAEKSQDLVDVWRTDDLVPVDVATALRDEVAAARTEYPDAHFTVTAPASATARAHPRVSLAIREALENAAQHNEAATVSTSVDVSDDTVTVTVSDTGCGIPAGEIEPLEAGVERPLEHTTGLGLWLMYWLVEGTDGGTLTFETTANSGRDGDERRDTDDGGRTDSDRRGAHADDAGGTTVEMTFPRA